MSFTIAHLSDPHLGPMPPLRLRDLTTKRALGFEGVGELWATS